MTTGAAAGPTLAPDEAHLSELVGDVSIRDEQFRP